MKAGFSPNFPVVAILFNALLSLSDIVFSQCGSRFAEKFDKLQDIVINIHVREHSDIPGFELRVVSQAIDDFDPDRMLLTEGEVKKLLDNSIWLSSGENVCKFYELFSQTVIMAQKRALELIDLHSSKPFDFNRAEKYFYENEAGQAFSKSREILSERWRSELKFQTGLSMAFKMLEGSEGDDNTVLPTLEKDSRSDVSSGAKCHLGLAAEDERGQKESITELLLNAYAQAWDPHSNYFSPSMKDNFDVHLSKEELSFGLGIELENGKLIISRIIPGGPAWRSNQLHEGDEIVSIRTGEGELLQNECLGPEEVMAKLTFGRQTEIEISTKQRNGSMKRVKLTNENLEVAENIVRGFILSDRTKVGYIALPSFYTVWNGVKQLGCANDVAKEIIQLKKSGIRGLILDLRFNGGGSLDEALELAGIFIDEGPLCLLKERESSPILLKDPNRGRVYDGPLIVMINELSASASELTASMLRDYQRAVIVGSTSHGKGTGQIVIPVDYPINQSNEIQVGVDSSLGFTKVTVEVLYDLQNRSHQAVGIVPDIAFPDLYRPFVKSEKDISNHIKPEPIDKKVIYKPSGTLPITSLITSHEKRVSADGRFSRIPKKVDELYHKYYEKKEISLKLDDLKAMASEMDVFSEDFESLIFGTDDRIKIDNHEFEKSILEFDEKRKDLNDVAIKGLSEDIYLHETFRIMADMIEFTR